MERKTNGTGREETCGVLEAEMEREIERQREERGGFKSCLMPSPN